MHQRRVVELSGEVDLNAIAPSGITRGTASRISPASVRRLRVSTYAAGDETAEGENAAPSRHRRVDYPAVRSGTGPARRSRVRLTRPMRATTDSIDGVDCRPPGANHLLEQLRAVEGALTPPGERVSP